MISLVGLTNEHNIYVNEQPACESCLYNRADKVALIAVIIISGSIVADRS